MIYYILLIIMSLLGAVASYFLKRASGHDDLIMTFKDKYLYCGGALYFLSALLNIIILKYLDYSVVFPLTSLTYVWTMFISWKLLEERITRKKVCGVCCIVIGAILVSC